MLENIPIFGNPMLRNLYIKGHRIWNLPSNDTEKKITPIRIERESMREIEREDINDKANKVKY